MGLEDLVGAISDFVGEFSENIQDAVVDIGEFSKGALENLGNGEIEALENGDLGGAIEYSDMPENDKELAKELVENIAPDYKNLIVSGAKVLGGTLGAVAAIATPGFQPAGLVAGAMAIRGMGELTSQLGSKNVAALADA